MKRTLSERWKADSSKIGRIIMKISAGCVIIIPLMGKGSEYAGLLPEGFWPTWFKTTVVIGAMAGYVLGKLTVAEK